MEKVAKYIPQASWILRVLGGCILKAPFSTPQQAAAELAKSEHLQISFHELGQNHVPETQDWYP